VQRTKQSGETKETVGHAVGNKRLEMEGKVDQARGAAHSILGDAKDAANDAIDSLKSKIQR
jgi:uncharacterized protein YjbJ (UPF0337 family)